MRGVAPPAFPARPTPCSAPPFAMSPVDMVLGRGETLFAESLGESNVQANQSGRSGRKAQAVQPA